uniref:Mitochondrial fission regulator n=1 Tax=Hucho hucho TaxID=62062 RepID=A0A4W5R159_9TELE
MRTENYEVIPIWQNKPHGSTGSMVRRIGSLVPMKPHPRACFQELPGLPPLRPMDVPMVPTLADIAWIAADEESESYARVRNSSVPNFRRDVKKVETLRKPAVTAMNRTSSLQDELRNLRSLSSANPLTPDPLSPNDTSMSFSMAPFKTVPYQPAASASFVISDVTDVEDVVSIVSELMPDPPPLPNVSAFMTTFDLDRPSMDFREAEEDMVLLSKSTSFADDTEENSDTASLISEALKKKFTLKDKDIVGMKKLK